MKKLLLIVTIITAITATAVILTEVLYKKAIKGI